MSDSEDEVLIEVEDEESPVFTPIAPVPFNASGHDFFVRVIQTFECMISDIRLTAGGDGRVQFSLPPTFLPLSLRAVYGFASAAPILDIDFTLADFAWDAHPSNLSVRHPVLGHGYVGQGLVQTAVDGFFSAKYTPRHLYRSQSRLLVPAGTAEPQRVSALVAKGFDHQSVSRALILFDNNPEMASAFLVTGEFPLRAAIPLPISYGDCPLLYLVLEIADAFLDLQDHCCLCRTSMPAGFKPSVCAKEICNFQLATLGIGNSVYQEIARDPLVADLLISVFATAAASRFIVVAPPPIVDAGKQVLGQLPAINDLIQGCRNDHDLAGRIGPAGFDLLRWILFSNRSHLMSLPPAMKIEEFGDGAQFLALMSSPEAEHIFLQLKEQFGSAYMWHGSGLTRWHSIIRTGLRNATGTALQAHGSVHGEGIYLARSSAIARDYSHMGKNAYKASALPSPLSILALCEVARLPDKETTVVVKGLGGDDVSVSGFVKHHAYMLEEEDAVSTCSMEAACVVRFLIAGTQFGVVDVIEDPPRKVPTLRDVLAFHASHAK